MINLKSFEYIRNYYIDHMLTKYGVDKRKEMYNWEIIIPMVRLLFLKKTFISSII